MLSDRLESTLGNRLPRQDEEIVTECFNLVYRNNHIAHIMWSFCGKVATGHVQICSPAEHGFGGWWHAVRTGTNPAAFLVWRSTWVRQKCFEQ